MAQPKYSASVSDLEAARRRQSPVSDADLLHRLLATHSEIVGAGLDLQRVVSVVTRRAQELTRSAGAVVELLDGDEFVYWAASGSVEPFLGIRVKADNSLSGLSARTRRVLVCDDSETDPRVDREACRRVGLRSMIVAPLPYGENIIGVLKVSSPKARAYGPSDVRTLELLDTLIGAAMANAAQHADAISGNAVHRRGNILARQISRTRIGQMIKTRDFDIVFQPIVDIQSGRISAYESLARFHSLPVRPPDKWFAEADAVNLGAELEIVAAEKAFAYLAQLPNDTYLSVNISPTTLLHPALLILCARFDATRIVFEITEHTSIDDYHVLNTCISRLRSLGIRFAIDDAGAGFASLRHILRLKPDFIKLDHSLTHDIDRAPAHQSLVAALLTFASGTSSTIIAEGIETASELNQLVQMGVVYGQGYQLGMPGSLPH